MTDIKAVQEAREEFPEDFDTNVVKADWQSKHAETLFHALSAYEKVLERGDALLLERIADVERLEKATGLTVEDALRKLARQKRGDGGEAVEAFERIKYHLPLYGQFECGYQSISDLKAVAAALQPAQADAWQDISTAPRDGTEILGWREDAGVMLIRWDAPENFLTEKECENIGESASEYSWMIADFVQGGRLEGAETPTLWQHIAPPKNSNAAKTLQAEKIK